MKNEETARRLRSVMREKGLSQQELANKSGVTKSSISHYVNGKTIPDNFQAYKLAKVLDVAPEWLMGVDDLNFIVVENTPLQKEIASMNEDQLKHLLSYARYLKENEK